jgi:hypothetical protein
VLRPGGTLHFAEHGRLPALASHGADALGVDIDPAMLALAAGRRPVISRSSARGTSWARPARLARRCPARLAL